MKNKLLVRLLVVLKASLHLGLSQILWYAIYQIGLRSGIYQRATPLQNYVHLSMILRSPFRMPESNRLKEFLPPESPQREDLITEANEIVAGQVRLFGGPPVKLETGPTDCEAHWSVYEGRPTAAGVEDIKYIWEPARFGWAYPLGRAYSLTDDERYPAAFWQHCETFLMNNPPNQGPNWSSAQEVALRMLAMLYAARVFEHSLHTTPERLSHLAGAIAAHAGRIPITISYARAQNNNHLITEALGLYAAGYALPEHSAAKEWVRLGWRWLNQALQKQIQPDGVYTQHSMNYHRLMLHAALQAQLMNQPFPPPTQKRLAAASRWLLAQVDPKSGRAPNLGANDGAHILPLSAGGFQDYRPVAQAAARAFLNQPAYDSGPWDELGLWLGQDLKTDTPLEPLPSCPGILRLGDSDGWASLRAVHYKSRPSHADQLHVDLWWRGENIALDAGTFRYTAPPPWDNTLAQTAVHNTIEANHQNQMQRAGRFLWLDWAQAKKLNMDGFQADTVAAQHNGYKQLGLIHRRILKRSDPSNWYVADHLLPAKFVPPGRPRDPIYPFTLHWLLPDWSWELKNQTLVVYPPAGGKVSLSLSPSLPGHPNTRIEKVDLVRAGKSLTSPNQVSPILGWFSPSYGYKMPALSFVITVHSPLPFSIFSTWKLDP